MKPDEIKKISALFIQALGARKVKTDRDILDKYSRDETSDLAGFPDILVRAESVKDVSETLKICNKHNVPVTPRGSGTGVTGGAVPVNGGVVLSLELLDRIIEIDKKNMVAVVEPGVITSDIQNRALSEGLMYPPDPASLDSCSIGGNVAENAGGPKAVKYGITMDYVTGLEFVLPDGEVIKSGGKILKNSTGYNLIGIILGSEGTLAVITKIYLKLVPAPKVTKDILIPFDSLEEAIDTVCLILNKKIVPAAIEFMEEDAIKLVAKHINSKVQYPGAGAHLLIQIDGMSENSVFDDLEMISEVIKADNEKIIIAESASHRKRLWETRKSIRESICAESPVFLAEDTVVPISEIPEFLIGLKNYLKLKKLRSVMFGHAGDGNVHIDILKDDMNYDEWKKMLPEIKREIYKRAILLGGTITGEHGIGCLRKDYLNMAISMDGIELSKRIKAAFDPKMILNPGKIF